MAHTHPSLIKLELCFASGVAETRSFIGSDALTCGRVAIARSHIAFRARFALSQMTIGHREVLVEFVNVLGFAALETTLLHHIHSNAA
jgi:hypothetical protein